MRDPAQPDQDRVIQRLDELARYEPSAKETQRALRRVAVQVNLEDSAPPFVARYTLHRKLIMRSSMAAAVLGLCLLTYMFVFPPEHADAAEQLEETVKATSAFEGWFYSKMEVEVIDEDRYAAALKQIGHEGPRATVSETYRDTQSGSYAISTRFDDGSVGMRFTDYQREQVTTYTSKAGVIEISLMYPFNKKSRELAGPQDPVLTIERLLAFHEDNQAISELTAALDQARGLRRFEMRYHRDSELPLEQDGPAKLTVWADPDSGLIQELVYDFGVFRRRVDFGYNVKEVKDVYQLGAPNDAQVRDHRPDDAVQALYHAIDEARAEGLGDYVALLAEVWGDDPNELSEYGGVMKLTAQQGDNLLHLSYLVASHANRSEKMRKRWSTDRMGPVPEGWPKPVLSEALQAVEQTIPGEYLFIAGEQGGRGMYNPDASGSEFVFDYADPRGRQMIEHLKSQMAETADIAWPKRYGGEGVSAEVIRHDEHPNWIGLRVTEPGSEHFGPPVKTIKTVWLDPEKSYCVAARTTESVSEQSHSVWSSFDYQYIQLADGRWFPSSWSTRSQHFDADGNKSSDYTGRRVVQVWQDKTIPSEWFADPRERIEVLSGRESE